MLDSLPAEQAETVRLKCYDSLTFRQIAELTEISEATVNSRCRYAIHIFRNNKNRRRNMDAQHKAQIDTADLGF